LRRLRFEEVDAFLVDYLVRRGLFFVVLYDGYRNPDRRGIVKARGSQKAQCICKLEIQLRGGAE